jgi:hypothetical protein
LFCIVLRCRALRCNCAVAAVLNWAVQFIALCCDVLRTVLLRAARRRTALQCSASNGATCTVLRCAVPHLTFAAPRCAGAQCSRHALCYVSIDRATFVRSWYALCCFIALYHVLVVISSKSPASWSVCQSVAHVCRVPQVLLASRRWLAPAGLGWTGRLAPCHPFSCALSYDILMGFL